MESRRGVRLALVLATVLAIMGIAGAASAATVTGTLRIDPATTTVAQGGTFSMKVISNTTVATSGVSVSITFDKSIVQVTTVTRSPAWAGAQLFLAADAAAIATANQKGVLKGVTAAFISPPASVPAGDQEFVTIGFKAVGCGTVTMGTPIGTTNSDSTLLDGRAATYGASIKLTTAGATVTVCGGAAGSGAPGASSSAQPSDSALPGASDSFDPNSSASPAPASSDSPAPGASVAPSASAPAGAGGADNGSSGTSEQSGWLTFAIAALAVAAAGLATLILIFVVVAIVATVFGARILIRNWRRFSEEGRPPADGGSSTDPAKSPADGAAAEPPKDADGAVTSGPVDQSAATPAPSIDQPPATPDRPTE